MLMRYHCGLGVGHSYARPASASSDQLSEVEEFVPEDSGDDAEDSRDQVMLPNQGTDSSASDDEDDEESCSDHCSNFTDASEGSEEDDGAADEELYEMDSMYGD